MYIYFELHIFDRAGYYKAGYLYSDLIGTPNRSIYSWYVFFLIFLILEEQPVLNVCMSCCDDISHIILLLFIRNLRLIPVYLHLIYFSYKNIYNTYDYRYRNI